MKCLQNSCTSATISDFENNSYTCKNDLHSLTNDAPKKKKKVIRILDLGRSEKKYTFYPIVFYLISVSVSLFDKRCVLVKLSCNRKNNNLLLFFLCTSLYSSLLNENVLLAQGFGLA